MDIHRCRFVPYPPSTINALAFSHSYTKDDQKTAPPRLAIGRANGDIEIWNPLRGSWLQETIIRGGKDRSIDGLVWTQDPSEEVSGKIIIGKSRLFSIGYTTTVTEWDLENGRPLRETSGNHGEIWCIAAQPAIDTTSHETNGTSGSHLEEQSLVTGCTDGALVLYSTADESLQLQRILARPSSKKGKAISVAFQGRNIVVAGYTDSTIRLVDVRNGVLLRSMTLGSGPKGGPKEILVWSVKVLDDGTIVSGDSTGEVKIWDGKTYTLRQRIKSHRQDVLSLATSYDGSAIFSGGMDRRTVVYKPVGKGRPRWAEVAHRRFHRHDVKTMASFEGNGMSVIVSGGPDASPTVVPLGQYGFENQRSLPFLSQDSIIRSVPRKRLVMSWWDREIHIWRLNKTSKPAVPEDSEEEPMQSRKLVAKVLIKGEANITCADLSPDGDILAVSTTTDIRFFLLRARPSTEGSDSLRVSKLKLPTTFSTGASLIQFSPDGRWLCIIRPGSQVVLARVLTSAPATTTVHPQLTRLTRLDRQVDKHITLGGLGAYDRMINQTAFSSDSRILAVSDLAGYIDTFVLSGVEDLLTPIPIATLSSLSDDSGSESEEDEDNEASKVKTLICGQHWTRNPSGSSLPKLPTSPVVLSFRPTSKSGKALTIEAIIVPHPTRNTPHPIPHDLPAGEDRLLIVTATSEVFEFDVLRGALSGWSRRNPTSSFPEKFRKTLETVKGCIWDVEAEKERVWLYTVNSLFMFDLSRDFLPEETEGDSGDGSASINANGNRKRKRSSKKSKSGAGGEIPDGKIGTGISRKIQHLIHEEKEEKHPLFRSSDDMDIDFEEDLERMDTLASLGRGGEVDKADNVEWENEKPHHWETFKYRPIMGIVVISEDERDGEGIGPEVVLVERPIWEVELPPRYYGDQEWRDKEVDIDGDLRGEITV